MHSTVEARKGAKPPDQQLGLLGAHLSLSTTPTYDLVSLIGQN
ncbi:hypothetical protein S7335_3873 [Synechococcus sp. PCC 7335]|nr:hypothetical protein S7335_3873 [Synechococcus sp. PCC 7335]